jgi:hypothetical protein
VKFTNVSEVLAASIIRDRHWVLKGLWFFINLVLESTLSCRENSVHADAM